MDVLTEYGYIIPTSIRVLDYPTESVKVCTIDTNIHVNLVGILIQWVVERRNQLQLELLRDISGQDQINSRQYQRCCGVGRLP